MSESWRDQIPQDWKDNELFIRVLSEFIEKERFILENGLNERTIAHKLAESLSAAFSEYDYVVDCEYNRMGNLDKEDEAKFITKYLELRITDDEKLRFLSVSPDIIVHRRGDNDNNYLIIEIKKIEYADAIRKDKATGKKETYRDFDKRKLRAFLRELDYQLGIYIEFAGAEISELYFERS